LQGLGRLVDGALPPPPVADTAPSGVVAAGFFYPAAFCDAVRALAWPDLAHRAELAVRVLAVHGAAAPALGLPEAPTVAAFAGYDRM
ncbi:hypothetical protein J8J40_29915, partial [Mycobacterium tuberculosis]|nr:hypothetical protein [Mycobacterium tuberculosis]